MPDEKSLQQLTGMEVTPANFSAILNILAEKKRPRLIADAFAFALRSRKLAAGLLAFTHHA